MTFYTIPDIVDQEIDRFERDIADFVAGHIPC